MWLKSLKLFLILISISSLVGCATTHKETMSGDETQTRITQLEEQLQTKDEEISDLKDQVQSLSQDSRRRDPSFKRAGSSEVRDNSKRDGILRVDVPSSQVQQALKNAGYYNGQVDGKLGDKTKRAIADFQKAHNLTADGVIGRKTWNVLKDYLKSN